VRFATDGGVMSRFVILRHEMLGPQRDGVHFDFMLEVSGVLCTWALPEEPLPGREMVAEALADHRLEYLDYEGPVSHDRGHVTRWDWGNYQPLVDAPTEVSVQLQGQRLLGTARLIQSATEPQRWMFKFSVSASADAF
jgi:hypothetical protein